MDLVTLPDNIKLKIFKELDWKDIINLKFVCRNFFLVTERNIQFLDRPKIHYLKIFCGGYRPMRVEFHLKHTRDMFMKHVYFENNFEYDNFLKDMDFTELRNLFLENRTSKISIRVLKSCSSDRNSLYHGIYISLSNGPLHRAHFVIRILGTKEHEITNNSNLLRKKSLKKLGLFEINGLHLAMNKIVMNVLNGNLILECNNISIDSSKPISTQIMNHLYEQGYFNLENIFDVNRNIQKKFTLRWNGEFDVSNQGFQRKLSNKLNFDNIFVGKNNCEKYYMISFDECSKSNAEGKNSTFYEKINGYLHNDLF